MVPCGVECIHVPKKWDLSFQGQLKYHEKKAYSFETKLCKNKLPLVCCLWPFSSDLAKIHLSAEALRRSCPDFVTALQETNLNHCSVQRQLETHWPNGHAWYKLWTLVLGAFCFPGASGCGLEQNEATGTSTCPWSPLCSTEHLFELWL